MGTIQNVAELISLGMTFPTIILAIVVTYTWMPSAIKSFKSTSTQSQEWFIIGVIIGGNLGWRIKLWLKITF